MKNLITLLCITLVVVFSHVTASADPITLTFDEVPPGLVSVTNPTPPAGTSPFLTTSGITFEFRVGGLLSADARYGANGPGAFTFVQGRVLEGDAAGILTLNFVVPTSQFQFGLGLTSPNNVTPGLTVELFDTALQSLGVNSVNTNRISTLPLSEGTFSYAGAPISRAVLNFNEDALAFPRRFALDNLTVNQIPEPTTIGLLSMGLAGLAARHARKKAARIAKEAHV
ncbi:MAG: PEP-CTERM sorting domain-containing protein [Acidobacteriota bacterium]|nr:PEP-CTERM sorting domain-containing protein [Acidobacteriota bacterium]